MRDDQESYKSQVYSGHLDELHSPKVALQVPIFEASGTLHFDLYILTNPHWFWASQAGRSLNSSFGHRETPDM